MTFISKYKKNIIKLCFTFFVIISLFFLVKNDYMLYDDTIATVMQVTTKHDFDTEVSGLKEDKIYTQILTLKIRNGMYKNLYIEIKNKYSETQMKETKYSKGDDVFINVSKSSDNLTGIIKDLKRDHYVALLSMLFILCIILLAKKQGILTLISLFINICIYILAVFKYIHSDSLTFITSLVVLGFCTFTLFILCGINIKSIGAIISSLVTIVFTYLIYYIVYEFASSQPPYEMLPYALDTNNLKEYFIIGTVIGCLGAIMDVAITMNSSLYELVKISPNITLKELIHSAREIGYDIMGTMINVLFFTYISGCLPMTILKFKNNYTITTLLRYDIFFDAVRFLIGSIGIVIAIPISTVIAILFSKNKVVKKHVINT